MKLTNRFWETPQNTKKEDKFMTAGLKDGFSSTFVVVFLRKNPRWLRSKSRENSISSSSVTNKTKNFSTKVTCKFTIWKYKTITRDFGRQTSSNFHRKSSVHRQKSSTFSTYQSRTLTKGWYKTWFSGQLLKWIAWIDLADTKFIFVWSSWTREKDWLTCWKTDSKSMWLWKYRTSGKWILLGRFWNKMSHSMETFFTTGPTMITSCWYKDLQTSGIDF